MSKKRLIPKLQLRPALNNPAKLVLVITKKFNEVIEIADPVSQAKIFQDQAADELVFVNIDRKDKSIQKLSEVIRKISEEIFMPLTVGGGVGSEQDFRMLLKNGADKIAINTAAVKDPGFIRLVSEKYGAQCVVVSIDYKKNNAGSDKVYINCGMEETAYSPLEWALLAEQQGAGELLLTGIDQDGMRNGIDLEVTKSISSAVKIPVITSGGCGLAQHFADAFILGKADAVAAGTFFAHRDQNLIQTRSQIRNAGVNIRVHN